MQRSLSGEITTLPAMSIDDALLSQCAQLFSQHYGVWSSSATTPLVPQSRVRMNLVRMRTNLLFNDTCGVAVYRERGVVLGQAFFCTFAVPELGDVRWITQLVVSSEHRRRGIAEMILNAAMFRRNHLFAAGLVSSHPAAIRALEAAAGARVSSATNLSYAERIHSHCSVPYLQHALLVVSEQQCSVDTHFFVDHTEVLAILDKHRQQRPDQWVLGELREGWEYFAVAIINRLS